MFIYNPAKLGVGGASFKSASKCRDCLANEEATDERLELRDEAMDAGRGGGVGSFEVSAKSVSSICGSRTGGMLYAWPPRMRAKVKAV